MKEGRSGSITERYHKEGLSGGGRQPPVIPIDSVGMPSSPARFDLVWSGLKSSRFPLRTTWKVTRGRR